MAHSKEIIALKNKATGEVHKTHPMEEYKAPPAGEYVILNYARLIEDGKTKEIFAPGKTVIIEEPVKEKPKATRKKKVVDDADV